MKPRHHLYLDDDLTRELEHLAGKPGASKSAIVTAALRQYLKHKGADERDEAFRSRLDRLSRQQSQTERTLDLVLEMLTQFVWLYLQLTAHMPAPDDAGRAQAHVRYDNFLTQVERAMAKHDSAVAPTAKSTSSETLPETSSDPAE